MCSSDLLNTFSLWCRRGFRDKLSATTASPGFLLQATDRLVPNPAVYKLGVTTNGVVTVAPVALGSGMVGNPVPVLAELQELRARIEALEAAR